MLWPARPYDAGGHQPFAVPYALDPAADAWEPLPGRWRPSSPTFVAWTGEALLAWSDHDSFSAWAPGDVEWRRLAEGGPRASRPSYWWGETVWSGTELLFVGVRSYDCGDDCGGGLASLFVDTSYSAPTHAYAPSTDTWREIPPPEDDLDVGYAVWAGDRLLSWDRNRAWTLQDDVWTRARGIPRERPPGPAPSGPARR